MLVVDTLIKHAHTHICIRYSGWDNTLRSVLIPALRLHRPDGILGFSQGAAATALLLSSLAAADNSMDGDGDLELKDCPRPKCVRQVVDMTRKFIRAI